MNNKLLSIVLAATILVASYLALLATYHSAETADTYPDDLYFGVTADGNVTLAKRIIDKVKGYTNLIVILNPDIVKNRTAIEEVCDYAQKAGLSFFVHMSHPSYWSFDYNLLEFAR